MYIRKASRTVHGKTYFNYLLVESHLSPKGPRQKVICSLGNLSPRPKEQWLEVNIPRQSRGLYDVSRSKRLLRGR